MTKIGSAKLKSSAIATMIGVSVTVGLAGCDDTNTDTDYKSIDVSQPVSDWEMVWNDEFDGDSIDSSKWFHEINCDGGGNQEEQCYTDSPENSYVADGVLNIVALPAEEGAPQPYTSARLNTKNLGDFKYGRFEMRAKLPYGQGSHPAFWMLPTDDVYGGWPNSGEIDILEAVNLKTINDEGVTESHIYGTLHYGKDSPNNSRSGKEYMMPADSNPADDYHTYAVEWQEGEMRWYVDGYLYATQMASKVRYNSKGDAIGLSHRGWFVEYYNQVTGELETHWDEAPFDQEFHLLLNLAVGGTWASNVNDGGIDPAAFADGQTYSIDYVRVYECSIDPDTGKGCDTVRAGYKDEEDALVIGAAPIPSPPSSGIPVNLTIFDDAENPLWQLWDCCGGSTPEVVDDEDANYGAVSRFEIGAAPTVMGYTTREGHGVEGSGPFDASPMIADGKIAFDMKIVTAPANATATWHLKVESSEGTTEAEFQLTESIEGVAPVVGEWQRYSFNLSTLADAGLDLSAIDVVMIFPAWGQGEGAVYHVDNVTIAQEGVSAPELILFEDTANSDWAVWDCCSGTMPTEEIDDEAHGTTVEFTIIGDGATVMGFNSRSGDGGAGIPFDATAILADGVFQFELKLMTPADGGDVDWKAKLESAEGDTTLDLDFVLDSQEKVAPVVGEWQTYTFKLADLSAAGLDVSAIDVVMIFPAWGTGTGAVYRVDNAKIYSPSAASSGGGSASGMLFEDNATSGWVLWDCCAGSTPTVETDDEDHGATAEFSIGATATVMGLTSRSVDGGGGVSFDASALLSSGVVQFDMKVVSAPIDSSADWKFKIESGGGDKAKEFSLTESLEGAAPVTGEWQTYTFTILDIFDAEVDISDIDVLMIFPAWGAGEGAVYRIDNLKIANP
ncbi:glycoside hydrolase family 16 protein [Thalassotalea crassostreae]|uniref:glycoside hydrolase family 16 protein n=1 Tax=Thalassotalea crassostreae TaxID=1763536 RepID=UPI0008394A99